MENKVILISNLLTPHQVPLADAICKETRGKFLFLETMNKTNELPIGWRPASDVPRYTVSGEMLNSNAYYFSQIENSQCVVVGSAPDSLVEKRLKSGKLTFKYAERFYKNGTPKKRFLRDAAAAWLHHGRFQKYPLYLLCASAYTAGDAARFGNYLGRCYKWGYFPETKRYDLDLLMQAKRQQKPSLAWAGRFIDWKHPEYALQVAQRLKNDGYVFELNMIGTGVMEDEIKAMITALDVEDCVHMLGSMPPEKVREHMETASIFLFTSDRQEGWGAVLNESMNSGCAVVACSAIGSVPFLVKDGENGLTYQQDDFEGFYQQVKRLLDHPQLCEQCGRAAYHTITEMWNAEVAAERLIRLAECLQNGEDTPFADGPCSKAEILRG